MTLVVMRKEYNKLQLKIKKTSSQQKFRESLLQNLTKVNLVNSAGDFQTFPMYREAYSKQRNALLNKEQSSTNNGKI